MGSELDFSGRRVLVTGGGRGIGLAIVKKFLKHNATVIVLEKEESLLQDLKASHPSVIGVHVDLTSWESTAKAVESVLPIHHLVNNAGVLQPVSFLDINEQHINFIFDVNFKAYVHVAQIVAKDMIKNKTEKATIVNMSSRSDQRMAVKGSGVDMYTCSKAAVTTLTRVIAMELSSHGIRVNCVRPGPAKTEVMATWSQEALDRLQPILDRQLYQRQVEPAEIADAVFFLSSDMSTMVTGTSLTVDGGLDLY
jgi:NAD(P)-dependent dehydrogenase (short-subunit alcohol dehydrogenase family)